ncbi:hypothetical protein [Streptomyces scabiei]|uniref:hypothetical protein n=1 Tax=Streptomyces scabiei TaxID=1930 RepID=UPI001FF26623|nr:hypothetical protein [Streptomyces sp. LBUM 1486]
MRDLLHRRLFCQEFIQRRGRNQVLLVRHPVEPQMPTEDLHGRRARYIGSVGLEVGLQGAVMRHDDHQMRLLFLHGLAQSRQVPARLSPLGDVRLGKVQQQPVTDADQTGIGEGPLFLPGQKLAEDTGALVNLVQQDAGCRGSAAARSAVQDHGPAAVEHPACHAHSGGVDELLPKKAELVICDAARTSAGRLQATKAHIDGVAVEVTRASVHRPAGLLDARGERIAHRSSSSGWPESPNRWRMSPR